ncbi:hypothetical protein CPB83DRAFT_888359 [Crepidotus variabilis]|uniref:Uncharacterized protein n=1 Tax=Crepidotus variabilis TaxID=179855 RepID=A0A9P6EV97_9AGAR|nr:hypothetical protein CPB83DRAFT_888359 [Crepidotus variabilis]
MPNTFLGQKSGDDFDAMSSRTTPRPSFSSPTDTTYVPRASTDGLSKPGKRAFPTAYSTPHDAVLSELQGTTPKIGIHDSNQHPTSLLPSPEIESGVQSRGGGGNMGRATPSPIPPFLLPPLPPSILSSSRPLLSDVLLDPFDGSNLGVLLPHGQGTDSQTPSQINLISGANSTHEVFGSTSNPVGSEAIWSHLSRVVDFQSEISKMHLDMETIGSGRGNVSGGIAGGLGSGTGKRQTWQSHKTAADMAGSATLNPDDPPVPPPLGKRRPRTLSTVSTISSGGEPEGDETGVNVQDEEEEKSRIRGEEFAKLASQFEGRKEAINDIMAKLDDLSKTLSEFHALPVPNIEFPASRNNSGGGLSPPVSPPQLSRDGEPKATRSSLSSISALNKGHDPFQQHPISTFSAAAGASSFLAVPPAPLLRAHSDTAAGLPTLSSLLPKKNIPTLLVNSMDPDKQTHVVDSPVSTLGSLKLSDD